MKHRQYFLLTAILITLLLGVTTVFAKKTPAAPPPSVTVVSRWTPQEQLVSVSSDSRTVNLQMSVRADRQFWAMDISCPVNIAGAFEPSPQMTLAGGWSEGSDTTFSDITTTYFDNAGTPNRINATVTRVGAANSPMGLNGTNYTESLFNLELTIAEGLVGTNIVSITCDKLSFLDRNGNSLGTAILDSTNNLTIRDGYVLSGSAARQGSSNQNEIEVSCEHDLTGHTYVATTQTVQTLDNKGKVIDEVSGQFSFSSAFGASTPLRDDFGLYKCTFTSKIGGTEDHVYLQGTSYINLQTSRYTLQPVILRAGDTDIDDEIDVDDFLAITTNWQNTVAALTNGDVNGDGVTNETDLAITAGNVGLEDSDVPADNDVLMDHVIYSTARNFNGTFPNNSLDMGDIVSGNVTTLSSDRVFWPQVSPDGSQIAYQASSSYQVDKKGKVTTDPKKAVQTIVEEGLFVANTTTFSGTLIAGGKNFAPSWSPSGNKIAYVCSWSDTGDLDRPGYQYNNGNICVVNASGGAIQTIIPSGAKSSYAEIFPPAWYDETTLVYAGNEQSTVCPDELCYYDMLTNTHGLVDIQFGVNGTSTFANMPVIIRKSDTLSYLFYRRFTSSASELRMGEIVYSGGSWSGGVLTTDINTPLQHEQVDNSDDVSYYDVSPMMDVMFYGFGDEQFHNRYFVDGNPFSWTTGEDHIVDGFIGYPTAGEFYGVWDGFDETDATDFHAFRATFDWIP